MSVVRFCLVSSRLSVRLPKAAASRAARSAAVFVTTALLVGCPSMAPVVPDDAGTAAVAGPAQTPVRSQDPQAGIDFALAQDDFTQGEFASAIDAFRMFAAEYPNDVLLVRAELFIARSQLSLGQSAQAVASLRAIAESPESEAIRSLATLYLGYAALRTQSLDAAMALVDEGMERSGARAFPQADVLPGDEASLASLWAETLQLRGEWLGALSTLEVVARTSNGDPALLLYAYDRATEVAETRMGLAQLQEAWSGGSDFVRGTVAGALVSALVDANELELAGQVLADAEPLMAALGLDARLDAARARVANASVQPLRWGIAVSLTGANRRAGRAALAAALLAQDAFSSAAPMTTLVVADTGSTVQGGIDAMRTLLDSRVAVVLGPLELELTQPLRQMADEADVPFVSQSTVPWTQPIEDTWRLQLDAGRDARTAVGFAMDRRQARTFLIVSETGLSSESYLAQLCDAARQTIEQQGGRVVAQLDVDTSGDSLQDSARATVSALRPLQADALYLAVTPATATALAAWFAASDVWPAADDAEAQAGRMTWVGNTFLLDEGLLRDSSRYIEGMVLPAWYYAGLAQGPAETFTLRFEHQFGRSPGLTEAFAYDASSWIRRVLQEGHSTPRAVATQLRQQPVVHGVTGATAPDDAGNLAAEPALVVVRGGVFTWLDVQ